MFDNFNVNYLSECVQINSLDFKHSLTKNN